jgi:DNA polymerase-3 subunit delta'
MPPWLQSQCAQLAGLVGQGKAPQALLVHGAAGTGRRHLAFWFAARLLGIPAERFARWADGELDAESAQSDLAHPDFSLVVPPPEKTVIPVDSIRALTAFLHLRSHQGGARVAVVYPADSMNPAAANSLLKTLEEPPAGSSIVLVASSPGRLPATVISRCQHLRVATPSREVARRWLASESDTVDWDQLLDFACGAPLEARSLHRSGFAARASDYATDLQRLRERRDTPVAVAKRWVKGDEDVLLRWLYLRAAAAVADEREVKPGDDAGNRRLQSSAKPLNMQTRLSRFRDVEELYHNRSRSMNLELQFTSALQRWYGDAGEKG